ncbi:hypothetical protein [Halobacillus litoralis]|uniref:hypothetical protein n=1 Tax=Halobacillus litoralis TaxID=45668 RepID=UPI001CFEDD6E|nr:hypothetical protein [Halobacillus litoralis]
MLEIFMIAVTVILVPGYVFVLSKKRKDMRNLYGWKGYVTPIVFIFAPVFALVSYLFELGGMVSWFVLSACFFIGAYYTKYLPKPKGNHT